MLLKMFRFQKWLGSPFPEDVWAGDSLDALTPASVHSLWSSLFESALLESIQACGHPCCLCTFSYPISSFQSTLHLICFDTALCEQPPLSVMTLCDKLFVEGVNDRFLDHCKVCSVPHYCGFKEQEIPTIYTIWMVIYWNSNVNIIFWDTDFWLSLAVSSNHQN